jgi:hypothetical protein
MVYRSVDPGGGWKIATEREAYLESYIRRVYKFPASREIKIVDLSEHLESRRLPGPRTEEEQSQDKQYHHVLQMLLATPLKTRDPLANWLHGGGGYLWHTEPGRPI